jgi:hypothetical protein
VGPRSSEWSGPGSNRRPPACKVGVHPQHSRPPALLQGLTPSNPGIEPPETGDKPPELGTNLGRLTPQRHAARLSHTPRALSVRTPLVAVGVVALPIEHRCPNPCREMPVSARRNCSRNDSSRPESLAQRLLGYSLETLQSDWWGGLVLAIRGRRSGLRSRERCWRFRRSRGR